MRRIPLLLAVAGSMLPTVAAPANAQAASGEFRYSHAYTRLPVILTDPAEGTCIQTTNEGCARNLTDRTVTLYPSPACQGEPLGTLAPGQSEVLTFASVVFSPG